MILLLVGANGVFAGAEIALVTVRRSRLSELAGQGRRGARAALALREAPERLFATVQIGVTVVGATAAALGGVSIAARLAPLLSRVEWLAPHAHSLALGLVVALVSYLSIVVGELVPKSLALRGAERYALAVSRPLRLLAWLARPLEWLLTASSNALLKPFGDRTTFTEARLSAEELQQLVDEATATGALHPHAAEIASRALDFAGLTASQVMVPRREVVAIALDAPPAEVRRILLERTHARMPVYHRSIDNVVGYLSTTEVLAHAWPEWPEDLSPWLRQAYFVPETKLAIDLLQEMRARRLPFAIVVDEAGGMAGIVTLEDLVEELVGEIFSEHALQVPHPIERQPDGTVLVDGMTPVRQVNRELHLRLPEGGDWTTVAGLCLALSGRIPAAGERIAIEGGVVLEVAEATPRRVRQVRIHAAGRGEPQGPGEGATPAPASKQTEEESV